jgi:signal transduction histidine kinase/DNA-binding response OmpR family regulator
MKAEKSTAVVTILVVEDSPTQAERLQYILEQHGYGLAAVRNGREALAAIERSVPTLVISDVVMPEMDGYQLCGRIKGTSAFKNIPVILLTSLNDPADVVRGLEAGADSFIFKPYDEQYLLARIAYILANRHLREREGTHMGVEVFFAGRNFFITSDRLQILNLLLSTFEAAVEKNRELMSAQSELRDLNQHLETRIAERTATIAAEIKERVQAQSRLQSQLRRLDLLHRITRAIGERQDLQSIFQVAIGRLEDDLPIDFGCVCLHEVATQTSIVSCVGPRSGALAAGLQLTTQAQLPIDADGLARCMRGELVYEADLERSPFAFLERLASAGLRSAVVAPLSAEGKIFGALVAARLQANSFTSADCEFLQQVSDHVALAAHQAQLYGSLQRAYEDLRQSQHTMLQQERLRALGQMASGVAHDINNALSPVALYTHSLLEREDNLSERARKYLTTIQRAVQGVAHTVARMREFYRPGEPQRTPLPIDINDLIQQVLDLPRVRWRDEPEEHGIVISVQTELASELPSVMGNESEMRDALTNLIFNAVDAMPDGGVLTLRTRSLAGTGLVRVEVVDTGVGMDADTRSRCLEPFFTTKGERGTGLGLAMVYGAVQRHNGEIEIDSERGKGTTIRIILPIGKQENAPTVRHPVFRSAAQRLPILIVDDDSLIIESLRAVLEGDGHVVTAAESGQAGIEAFDAALLNQTPFALVITDLGMPYVDGRRVAAAVKAVSPATPVVMLTGWGQRLIDEQQVPPHVDRVLNKPPKVGELRLALAELAGG